MGEGKAQKKGTCWLPLVEFSLTLNARLCLFPSMSYPQLAGLRSSKPLTLMGAPPRLAITLQWADAVWETKELSSLYSTAITASYCPQPICDPGHQSSILVKSTHTSS